MIGTVEDEAPARLLPTFQRLTSHLDDEQAHERWRASVSQTYRVHRASDASRLPRGSVSFRFLDGIIVNRATFGPQRAVRDRRLIDNTPDHVMLQLWLEGGYRGTIDGRQIVHRSGHTVLADRRREHDLRFATADTFGLIIPRDMLDGLAVDDMPTTLDPVRDRLATARLKSLYHTLPAAGVADVPRLSAELLAFVRRLLDPSRARDVLHAPELDAGIVDLARRVIAADLEDQTLSPDVVAARVGVSRAALYRAFAPEGGVMRCVWDMRLDAVKAAIEDAHIRRSLTQTGFRSGFTSLAHLSRSFSRRFGATPSEWRRMHDEARRSATAAR